MVRSRRGDTVVQTLYAAWRSLRRRRRLIVAVGLTLGLGLGANVTMFSVIDALLLHAPSYLRDPGSVNRVYLVWRRAPDYAWTWPAAAYPSVQYRRFREFSEWITAFSQTAAFARDQLPVGTGQATRDLMIGAVSASYFSFFNTRPVIGRYFTAAEDSAE